MLINTLFTFSALEAADDIIKTDISLDPSHPIFQGHFPGQPVLPGVCMMQMVKEVLESYLQKPTRITQASDLKFLSLIVPESDKTIQMELKISYADDVIKVDARLQDEATVLFKFKGNFVVV